MSMSIKKGDKVEVLSGKDRGKQGIVLRALPKEGKVVVEGVAIVKKAVKPNQQNQQGGIVSQEAAIDASNVNLVCPKCGQRTRVGPRGRRARWSQDQAAHLQEVRPQVLSCPQHQVASKGPDATAPGPFSIPTRWLRFCRPVIPVASSFRCRLESSAVR